MEPLIKKHVFSYWKHYKSQRGNRKPQMADIAMMKHFEQLAKDHIMSVLRPDMIVVYKKHDKFEKGIIKVVNEESFLIDNTFVPLEDVYYVTNE